MKLRISKYLFLLMMAVFALSSCSEDDNTVDEYANWQERNENNVTVNDDRWLKIGIQMWQVLYFSAGSGGLNNGSERK